MRYSISTNYPEKLDPLLFYSDASYESKDTIEEFKTKWQNWNIDGANIAIKNDEKLHYASADLLNRFEYQLKALQEYLLIKERAENPMVYGEEPTDPDVHFIWVEDIG